MPERESAVFIQDADGASRNWDHHEPSQQEILLMFAMVCVVHVLTVCRVRNFWSVANAWYDNPAYIEIATIIKQWHFSGAAQPWHFWGFPVAIAGISKLCAIHNVTALVLISALSSLAVCILVYRLYGGWVAAALFSFINYRWIYSSVEGGSEPLFMCLVFAGFIAARKERWSLAGLLAALSMTVRPVGVFALIAFAGALAQRKRYKQLASVILIALALGLIYIIPLWIIFGNPLANFIGYARHLGSRPITYPFGVLISGYWNVAHLRWPTLALSGFWLAFLVVANVAIWLPQKRAKFLHHEQEPVFCLLYSLFFACYGEICLFIELPRFFMPLTPLFLFSVSDWIPRSRILLWSAALLSALLASAAMVGFGNIFGFRLP